MSRDRAPKLSEQKKISLHDAKRGANGYTVLCISMYGSDVRMTEALMERTGMNRSELIRVALHRFDEATRADKSSPFVGVDTTKADS